MTYPAHTRDPPDGHLHRSFLETPAACHIPPWLRRLQEVIADLRESVRNCRHDQVAERGLITCKLVPVRQSDTFLEGKVCATCCLGTVVPISSFLHERGFPPEDRIEQRHGVISTVLASIGTSQKTEDLD